MTFGERCLLLLSSQAYSGGVSSLMVCWGYNMKTEKISIVVRVILVIITCGLLFTACAPLVDTPGYTDQPLSSQDISDNSSYTRIHMDRFVDQKGLTIIRFIDPDNGTTCYIRGDHFVCFEGE